MTHENQKSAHNVVGASDVSSVISVSAGILTARVGDASRNESTDQHKVRTTSSATELSAAAAVPSFSTAAAATSPPSTYSQALIETEKNTKVASYYFTFSLVSNGETIHGLLFGSVRLGSWTVKLPQAPQVTRGACNHYCFKRFSFSHAGFANLPLPPAPLL